MEIGKPINSDKWSETAEGVARERVRSCPRAGCGRSACPVRRAGCGNGATATPLRHRQTKEAETDMCSLKPPRHISTPPWLCKNVAALRWRRMSIQQCRFWSPKTSRAWSVAIDVDSILKAAPRGHWSHSSFKPVVDLLPQLGPGLHDVARMERQQGRCVGLEAAHEKHRGRSRRDHRESNG